MSKGTIEFIEEAGTHRPRVLTAEEVETLKPVFEEFGGTMPNPATSFFVGVVRDGKVTGFLTIALAIHAEPMWIEPGNEQDFLPITREAERIIVERCGEADIFLFAPEGRITALAESRGMVRENWNVMSKHVGTSTIKPLEVEPVVESSELEDSAQPETVEV